MLCRNLMPRTDDAALEQTECALYAVSRNIAVNVDSGAVVYRFVLFFRVSSKFNCPGVRSQIVRHNHMHIITDVFLNIFDERSALSIFGPEKTEFAIPLLDSNDALFMVPVTLVLLAVSLTADICFIHLHNAIQRLGADLLHRGPHSVAEIPRRLVGDTKSPLELIGAHPLLGFAQQVDAQKPLPQGEVGVVEDRSSSHGELIAQLSQLN